MGCISSKFSVKNGKRTCDMLELPEHANENVTSIKPKNRYDHQNDDSHKEVREKPLAATPGMFIQQQKAKFTDKYKCVKNLGSGAYGNVIMCIDRRSGAERAVKVIKKSTMDKLSHSTFDADGNNSAYSSMMVEIDVLRNLDHPNIMKLYEFFEDAKSFYLVMELYSGGELFDEIIQRQRFSEVDAARIIRDILSGCNYLHNHHIVHRDLKPENLLLENKSADALIKIVDFGLSVFFDPRYKLKERLGTAYYIAPEVLRKKYDQKCDIWSVGVITYILLCGHPPFSGRTDFEILKKVEKAKLNFEPMEWNTVSKDAKALVQLMLTHDPVKRISAHQALEHPWIVKMTSNTAEPNEKILSGSLNNMRKFRACQKLAQATMLFAGSRLATFEETRELSKIFHQLDTNNDGQLDINELVAGCIQLRKMKGEPYEESDEETIMAEVKGILESVDFDQNGYIEYSEFVTACLDRNLLLSNERLKAAFHQFDLDGDGSICSDELAVVFGQTSIEDSTWQEILHEADQNNDGLIDFREFTSMMQRICELQDNQ